MPPPNAEQISFHSHCLPAIGPGAYTLTVTPTLNLGVSKEPLDARAVTETFHVGAPRFALTGSEAYACYPAPGQIGAFFDTLPHVVLDRCTLPWERTIEPGGDPTDPHDPWLALILLTDGDFPGGQVPPIEPRTVAQVLRPAEPNVVGPALGALAKYERETDPCQTIDLPAKVFHDVVPPRKDLRYLAHVREVETDHKETWSLLKEGKFSVIVCNRFPETQATGAGAADKDWGIVNTVCLVSLEGWGGHLDGACPADDKRPLHRLVVLGSWRFTCQGSSAFKSQMKALDIERLLSLSPPSTGAQDRGRDYVRQALARGFVPLNHDRRDGARTISWYRGPLVPVSVERRAHEAVLCADAALAVDPATALLDASGAAAWQLGRLLALQDQAFAQAVQRYRADYQRWVRTTNTAQYSALRDRLGARLDLREHYARVLQGAGVIDGDARREEAADAGPALSDAPAIPETVQDWLGQALLLYGVPFSYLVPDEAMLPLESIRFFYLDPGWVNALLQGACSVGRSSGTDELADQLLRAKFFDVSEKMARALRSSAKDAADARRGAVAKAADPDARAGKGPAGGAQGTPDGAGSSEVLHWPLSGFLLRSDAVASWIGLEARARGVDLKGTDLDPLRILRLDRLAPDILFCLYDGKVTSLEVKQPPEAVHFGAASTTAGAHQKTELRTSGGKRAGAPVVPVPTSESRVIQASQLAGALAQALGVESFTPAHFALEMIESPAKVTFRSP